MSLNIFFGHSNFSPRNYFFWKIKLNSKDQNKPLENYKSPLTNLPNRQWKKCLLQPRNETNFVFTAISFHYPLIFWALGVSASNECFQEKLCCSAQKWNKTFLMSHSNFVMLVYFHGIFLKASFYRDTTIDFRQPRPTYNLCCCPCATTVTAIFYYFIKSKDGDLACLTSHDGPEVSWKQHS